MHKFTRLEYKKVIKLKVHKLCAVKYIFIKINIFHIENKYLRQFLHIVDKNLIYTLFKITIML
jgi:hypothetical protein